MMGRRAWLLAGVAVGVVIGGGSAFAASRYIITSVNQIKPSVRAQLRGSRGPTGARGAQGVRGAQGLAGLQGEQGPPGSPGTNGTNGTDGTNGTNGTNGLNGAAVIARASGSGDTGTNNTPQTITLANATFTNSSDNTDNLIYASGTYINPQSCAGGNRAVNLIVKIDNTQVHDGNFGTAVGGPLGALTFIRLGPIARISLGAGPHTLSVQAYNGCTGAGEEGSVTIQIDTVALL